MNQLKPLGIRVIFEQEELDTTNTEDFYNRVNSQAENESRSDNIKWGIKQHAANGTSKLYNRKCYGYVNANDGSLIIEPVEAENVKLIFSMYIQGESTIGIVFELEKMGIKSPTGKGKWCKQTIDVMLSNEKYTGNVRLLDDGKHDAHYLAEDNNPAIISTETFKAVQIEKQHRSNVTNDEDGNHRKCKKYSSKK